MKIIGKTLEGDLIIQVSQAEWDGLGDGVRPKEDKLKLWLKTEARKLLNNRRFAWKNDIVTLFFDDEIDGSIQSLRDIADGKIYVGQQFGRSGRKNLKTLLDNHTSQAKEKP